MTDSKTATERLHELLDERGVEWWCDDCPSFDGKTLRRYTYWGDGDGNVFCEPIGASKGTLGALCDFSTIGFTPEQAIAATLGSEVNGDTSDGYHTFDELYYHRTALFACLVASQPRQMAFKSWKHADGTMYDGMFIAGIYTSEGWCTYHCEARWWPLFDCSEREFAPEWDGHTPSDAIHRLMHDMLPKQDVRGEVEP